MRSVEPATVVVDPATVVVVAGAVVVGASVVVGPGGGASTVITFESVNPEPGSTRSIFHCVARARRTSWQKSPLAFVVTTNGPNRSPVFMSVAYAVIDVLGGYLRPPMLNGTVTFGELPPPVQSGVSNTKIDPLLFGAAWAPVAGASSPASATPASKMTTLRRRAVTMRRPFIAAW